MVDGNCSGSVDCPVIRSVTLGVESEDGDVDNGKDGVCVVVGGCRVEGEVVAGGGDSVV